MPSILDDSIISRSLKALRYFLPYLISFLIVLCSFNYSIKNHMHQCIGSPVDYYTQAISIAISNLKHDLHGYVGYNSIYDFLFSEGMTYENAEKCIESPHLINNPIEHALTLKNIDRKEVHIFFPGDYGFVDYVKLAFLLFGYSIKSLLYLYFLVILFQISIFFIEFKKNKFALIFLFLFLSAQYLTMCFAHNLGIHLYTIHNYRYLSILGILPTVHIGLLFLKKSKLSFGRLAYALLQSVMLISVVRARNSAFWLIVLIFFLFSVGVLFYFTQTIRHLYLRSSQRKFNFLMFNTKFRLIHLWPFILVLLLFCTLKIIEPFFLHPTYFDDEISIRNHASSMVFYLGLAQHPEIRKEYSDRDFHDEVEFQIFSRECNMDDMSIISRDWKEYEKVIYCVHCMQNKESDNFFFDKIRKFICRHIDFARPILRYWYFFRHSIRADDSDAYNAVFKWIKNQGQSEYKLFTFEPDEPVDLSHFLWFRDKVNPNSIGLRAYNDKTDFKHYKASKIWADIIKDVINNHPYNVLELFFIIKPLSYIHYYINNILKLNNIEIATFCSIVLLFVVYLFINLESNPAYHQYFKISTCLFIFFFFSLIIPILAYTNPEVNSDSYLIFTMVNIWFVVISIRFIYNIIIQSLNSKWIQIIIHKYKQFLLLIPAKRKNKTA